MSEAKQDDSMNKAGVKQLMMANKIHYSMPSELNVVSSRQLQRHDSNKSSYSSSDSPVIFLNSGEAFVDGQNSYLSFVVKTTATANAETHGALAFIRGIELTTHSGVSIERTDEINNLQATLMDYEHDADHENTFSTVFGKTKTTDLSAGAGQRFIIPMSKLSGLFKSDKLLVGLGLCSGLKIQITLEDDANVCKWTGAADVNGTYTISDMYVMTDSHTLQDGVIRAMNKISATQTGLQLMFDSWDTQTESVATSSINSQVKRGVSQATMCIAKLRLNADFENTTAGRVLDSFRSDTWATNSYQFNLGSRYYPNQALTTHDVAQPAEALQNALYSFGKKHDLPYGINVDTTSFGATKGVHCCVLERSSVELSALPLGSSRSLVFKATLSGSAPRTLSIFTKYKKVLNIFLDKTLVKD